MHCCQLDLSCFPLPLVLGYSSHFMVSCCVWSQEYWLLLGSLCRLIESVIWCLEMWLGRWVTERNFPQSSTFISGAWSNFLESLAECRLLGPSLMGGGPEDRSQGLFPSWGRQLPMEAVTYGFVLCSPGRRLLPDSCRLPLASGSCWRKSCPPDAAPSLLMALHPWWLPVTGLSRRLCQW